MQKPTLLLLSPLLTAGTALAGHATPSRSAHDATTSHRVVAVTQQGDATKKLRKAKQLLNAGKFDDALLLTDELLQKNPKLRQAHIIAARCNLALLPLGRTNTRYLLEDAVGHLGKALKLQNSDPDTWLLMADAQLKKGAFTAGRDAAVTAAMQFKERQAPKKKLAEAVLKAAENELQMFVAKRRQELAQQKTSPEDETVKLGRLVLSRLKKAEALGAIGEAYLRSSYVHSWLGHKLEAVHELERGIGAAPEHFPLHKEFRDMHVKMGRQAELVATYKNLMRSYGSHPGMLWGIGIAEVLLADKLRRSAKPEPAARQYRSAVKHFANAAKARHDWRANCNHYRAICRISLAQLSIDDNRIEEAKQELAAAFKATPNVVESAPNGGPKVRDSFGRTYFGSLGALAKKLASGPHPDKQRAGLDFWMEMIARHPNRFGWMYNNAALHARDLGDGLIAVANHFGGDKRMKKAQKEAKKVWEQSYRLYRKAVELSPDDPRIVNDCAVLLVYQLKRDYGQAKKLLLRAIAIGSKELENLDDAAPAKRRESLEEAVGDAHENMAVMLKQLGKPFADYRSWLEKAVDLYPYKRRLSWRMLRAGRADQNAKKQGGK